MLERDAYRSLLDWKSSGQGQALLVTGARQIGKTFLIDEFGRREFDSVIKVDFINDPRALRLFGNAGSAQDLIERLTLRASQPIVPGKTLLFFDEVQEAPNVVALSKYLVQDGRFPLVMSGSMLGTELRHVSSLPVGYMRTLDMFPLSFMEFARSQGVASSLLESLRGHFEAMTPVDSALHEELVRLFRLYLVVGGMPQAVTSFIDSRGDLNAVRSVQGELMRLYREDISKYTGSRAIHVKAVFDAIPTQLNKENKRFELKTLADNAMFARFAKDFAWLVAAGAALKTNCVTEPKHMLARTEEQNRFKLYQSDTGMLFSAFPPETALDALSGARAVNFGSVYENAVAQELAAAGIPLRYYRSNRHGEVDFLAETARSSVVALEVKSGKDYKRHSALNNLLGSHEYGVEAAYVLSEGNLAEGEKAGKPVHYIPLYMLPFLTEALPSARGAGSERENARIERSGRSMKVQLPDFSSWN